MSRELDEWSELQFVQSRYTIWLGANNPKTISAKELIDNGLDQIADGKATEVMIHVGKERVVVFDNGGGISLKKSGKSGRTFLMLAVNKLYTSSNYEGTELTGTNGVGATVTNYLSKSFKAGHIKDGGFKGYLFENGLHKGENEEADVLDTLDGLKMVDSESSGFYVDAEFSDEHISDTIDADFLLDYVQARVGDLAPGALVSMFIDGSEGQTSHVFDKIKGSENYQPSWEEQVRAVKSAEIVVLRNGWSFAYCGEDENFNHIRSMVQGAPVLNKPMGSIPYIIEDIRIPMSVPYTFYYKGKKNPEYQDQTKTTIKITLAEYSPPFKTLKSLYKKYYASAEAIYLARILTDSKSTMYFPADPDSEIKEIIVSEGFSAMSNIKSKRQYSFQACFALRGKFLNVMQMDLKSAMKSDVVRDFLNIILKNKFERIVLTPDADADGAHICTLLLGVIHKYARRYLEEGRVYYCKTPLFVFEHAKTKDIQWSNDSADCPEGYMVNPKKGLGSYTRKEIKMFVTNPDTRELWQFTSDGYEDVKALEFALIEGGKDWIVQ